MKSSGPEDTLARTDDPMLEILLAEMMDEGYGCIIPIPQLEQPLEEWPQRCGTVLVTPENQVEWVEYDEYWAEFVNLSLKHLPMLLECQVKAEVVQHLEREILGKVQVH